MRPELQRVTYSTPAGSYIHSGASASTWSTHTLSLVTRTSVLYSVKSPEQQVQTVNKCFSLARNNMTRQRSSHQPARIYALVVLNKGTFGEDGKGSSRVYMSCSIIKV